MKGFLEATFLGIVIIKEGVDFFRHRNRQKISQNSLNLVIKSQKLYQCTLIIALCMFRPICSRVEQFLENRNFDVEIFLCPKKSS